jgi:sterol desaturase/sphingolipid hydroxylase (fatty acid hydroxylase superfamily)
MEQNKKDNSAHAFEQNEPETPTFGIRDKKGEWRPPYPCSYAPLFTWPLQLGRILKWVFSYPGYIWPIHLIFVILALITWGVLQPDLARCTDLKAGWIGLMFLRNMGLIWLVYGGLHLSLYTLKLHGSERKYHPKWQAVDDQRYLFKNQIFDNVFRTCVVGCPIWTAYEVLYIWTLANGWIPSLNITKSPIWFVVLFLLIPIWREVHFYLIHRLIHWRPLLKTIHYVHHLNPNPGPWSGLAMHPVEHLVYFSVVMIHFIVPSHPIHFFFNSQLTALTPANGHHGFEGPLFNGKLQTGSYFHYLHHRYVSCNFGESTVPLDRWFGRFYDGTGSYRTKPDGGA